MRSAPEAGYLFPEKEEYRQHIWRFFSYVFVGEQKNKNILLMPSLEGREIEVALDHGFRVENLHVVDRDPAVVAVLQRKFRGINTYGVSADRACERISKKGIKLHAANFDFTGNLSKKLRSELEIIANSDCWALKSFVNLTLFRGRETGDSRSLVFQTSKCAKRWLGDLQQRAVKGCIISENDAGRLLWSFDPFVLHHREITVSRCGNYSSTSGTSMLWAICRIRKLEMVWKRYRDLMHSPTYQPGMQKMIAFASSDVGGFTDAQRQVLEKDLEILPDHPFRVSDPEEE